MNSLKTAVKKSMPALYDSLVSLGHSRAVRALGGTGNRYALQKMIAGKKPFRVDIASRMGFGATLSNVVVVLDHLERFEGFRGVCSSNPLYLDRRISENMLDLYFDRVKTGGDEGCATIQFRNRYDISLRLLGQSLTIARAHELFNLHFRVKPEFMEEAEAFHSAHLGNAIGVHYRGSDKRLEATAVDWNDLTRMVDECLDLTGSDDVFLATDEPAFMDHMRQRYGSRVKALECRHWSRDGVGAHFVGDGALEKGREALLTILLLSMCKLCIRGASHLSAWAKIMNPELEMIMCGRPFEIKFPEGEIMKSSAKSAAELMGSSRTKR
jgi:hypothetical protein